MDCAVNLPCGVCRALTIWLILPFHFHSRTVVSSEPVAIMPSWGAEQSPPLIEKLIQVTRSLWPNTLCIRWPVWKLKWRIHISQFLVLEIHINPVVWIYYSGYQGLEHFCTVSWCKTGTLEAFPHGPANCEFCNNSHAYCVFGLGRLTLYAHVLNAYIYSIGEHG